MAGKLTGRAEPDWRDMFMRYIEAVGEAEGVTFLYESDWSPEEWQEIQIAERESYGRRERNARGNRP